MKIVARSGAHEINIFLNDSRTAQQIYNSLPLDSKISVWGEEIYFRIPARIPPENPTVNIRIKDVCYWPQGACVCIFFGPTPMSPAQDPVPASAVTLIGRAECSVDELRDFREGDKIVLNRQDKILS